MQLVRGKPNATKEKSLGTLAYKFIRLLKMNKMMAIEKAAEVLSHNITNKYKTKVGRGYQR